MKNKFVKALLCLSCFTACGDVKEIPNIQGFTPAETCLIDFVDPQDGEGGSEEEIRFMVNNLEFDLVPASIYSESNHLYKKNGDCPIMESDLIENIEPSATYKIPDQAIANFAEMSDGSTSSDPNDPLFKHQWNFQQIDAPKAWETSNQGKDVIVAVIDTGVAYKDYKHELHALEDLAGTKFTKGVSFCGGLPDGLDDHAHGSHVAGTIAQTTNNGLGVAGVAPKAVIMPLKVLSASGSGTTEDIATAIRYAADNGAKVINMSLGGPSPSRVMEDAVNYAHEKGVTVVCAAGNENSSRLGYPAGYENCIAVSAVNKNVKKAFYSNYGDITVAAPGGDTRNHAYDGILQNTIYPGDITNQGYYAFQGTSMASPHAAAVAALIIGEGVTDNKKVWEILIDSSVHPDGKDWDEIYGAGVINANNAVAMAKEDSGSPGFGMNPKFKFYLIGGVLVFLLMFVGTKAYNSLKVEDEYEKYSFHEDDDDEEDI